MKKLHVFVMSFVLVSLSLMGCKTEEKPISFADPGWDSVRIHTAIAQFIFDKAYGVPSKSVNGSGSLLHEALKKNEVQVHMEVWTDNIIPYNADVAAGAIQEMGVNFADNASGFYVPRYVIEGDPKRNIAPSAPNLRTVQDLLQYPHVFPDVENKGKGRIYGAVPGWLADTIMHKKFKVYGLDKSYIYFRPGSDSALSAVLAAAYEKGEPIVGYYWMPTWLLGKYDFVLLEDNPYVDEVQYKNGVTACPSMRVTVATSTEFAQKHPELTAFLRRYATSSESLAKALAHMQTTKASMQETALWFMRTNDAMLDLWLEPDKAKVVREALAAQK